MDDTSQLSQQLLKQWEAGEQDAATRIFDRYVKRLVRLVNSQLASSMRTRFDAEDVVQTAFREFFEKAARHEVVLRRSGALWSLLAAITLNKLKGQIEIHTAKKRSPKQEQPPTGPDLADAVTLIDRDPTPEDAAALLDELEQVMKTLRPNHREILALRLQGKSIEYIAQQVSRTEATVQQVLRDAEAQLRKRLTANG